MATMKALPWRSGVFALVVVGLFALALWALGSAAQIFLISFGGAYLTFPLIRWLETKKIPRIAAVSLIFMIISGLIVLGIVLVLPPLLVELREFLQMIPDLGARALTRFKSIIVDFHLPIPIEASEWPAFINSHLNEIVQKLAPSLFGSASSLITGTTSILLGAMNLILIPIFFFYLVLDYEKLLSSVQKILPRSWTTQAHRYGHAIDQILAGFIRGQMVVCLCLSALYGIGLAVVGVRFGFLIGVIGGLLSFIPYVGGGFCLLTSTAVALALGAELPTFIGIGVVFAVIQSFESFFLTPRLVGNKVGLNPLFAMLALIAGANTLGFWGLVLAIPLGGLIKFIALDLLTLYRGSMFYRNL